MLHVFLTSFLRRLEVFHSIHIFRPILLLILEDFSTLYRFFVLHYYWIWKILPIYAVFSPYAINFSGLQSKRHIFVYCQSVKSFSCPLSSASPTIDFFFLLIVANLRRTQLRNELNELEGVNDSTNSENISLRRDKVLLTDEVATLNGKVGVYLVSLDPPRGEGVRGKGINNSTNSRREH